MVQMYEIFLHADLEDRIFSLEHKHIEGTIGSTKIGCEKSMQNNI